MTFAGLTLHPVHDIGRSVFDYYVVDSSLERKTPSVRHLLPCRALTLLLCIRGFFASATVVELAKAARIPSCIHVPKVPRHVGIFAAPTGHVAPFFSCLR